MTQYSKKHTKVEKFNILFVSSIFNYFVNNNAHFSRMYNCLNFFHNNKEFNVYVLQPSLEKKLEDEKLKGDIKVFYFKSLYLLKHKFAQFNDFNPFFITKVIKILKRFNIDLIHVESHYSINVIRLIKRKIPVSYNSYNVEYIYADEILKYYHKYPRFSRYFLVKYNYFLERYAVKSVKNINTVTTKDKKDFIKIYKIPEEKIIVNSFGYDKNIFYNPINKEVAREKLGINKYSFVVIFHGSYLLKGNKEAFEIIRKEIAPNLINENILFLLAGKGISFTGETKNIKILGYVSDLRYFLYSADVALVPLMIGAGIKTKILDYLSANIPVITTKIGSEGLHLKNNIHGIIIKDPIKDAINAIVELKNNPAKISEFKSNTKELLEKEFNWEMILTSLSKNYKRIILNK